MTLFRQQFSAHFAGLLIWCAVGMLCSMTVAAAAVPFAAQGSVATFTATLPPVFARYFGMAAGLSALDAYMSMKWAYAPILMVALYAVMMALSVITREVDRRTIDFLLSLPVQRYQVILSRVAVMAVNTAILGAVTWGGMRASFASNHLTGSFGLYGLVVLAGWLSALAIGSLALLSSVWLDDYAQSVKIWLGLVTGLYLLDMILSLLGVSRWVRFYNPFSYANAATVMSNGSVGWANAVIMVIVTLLAVGLSIPAFERKQIAA